LLEAVVLDYSMQLLVPLFITLEVEALVAIHLNQLPEELVERVVVAMARPQQIKTV
jgi:hypothetical protein